MTTQNKKKIPVWLVVVLAIGMAGLFGGKKAYDLGMFAANELPACGDQTSVELATDALVNIPDVNQFLTMTQLQVGEVQNAQQVSFNEKDQKRLCSGQAVLVGASASGRPLAFNYLMYWNDEARTEIAMLAELSQ